LGRTKGAKNKKKPVSRTPIQGVKQETIKKKCTRCGKVQAIGNYYNSTSQAHEADEVLSVCKTCVGFFFDEYVRRYDSYKKAMYYTCRKLDIPFNVSCYIGGERHANTTGWMIYQGYMKQLNSFRDANGYGNSFDDSDELITEDTKLEGILSNNDIDINIDNFEVNIELINKWANLPKRNLLFLEAEYQDWSTRYEISSKSMELLIKEICYQQLLIQQKKEEGKSVAVELKTLQELMNSGALKPIQESAAQSTEVQTFGTLIKKWENEKPIPKADKEFEDVDGIKKYISIWFFGHLCKMLGIQNDYSKQYDDEIMKYTVDMPEMCEDIEDGEDD
jgi:hypothetical protein